MTTGTMRILILAVVILAGIDLGRLAVRAMLKLLLCALEEYNGPHDYIEFLHSAHGLQNDNDMGRLYNEKIEEYLETYLHWPGPLRRVRERRRPCANAGAFVVCLR